jgi:hypothetical protein
MIQMSPIQTATNIGTEMRERRLAPSRVPPIAHSSNPIPARSSLAFRDRLRGFVVSMRAVLHAGDVTIMAAAMRAV